MLIGEYRHNFDAKHRVALPAKFRKELGRRIVLTHGLDNCLFAFPLAEWQKVGEKLTALSIATADTRRFNRFLLAGAVETEVDSLGRVLVPEFLRAFAGLSGKVVIAGVYNRLEIWDERRWDEYKSAMEKQADVLAEKLGELGVL